MPNYKRYYLPNHYVFISVVTYNRNPILIKNIKLLNECFNVVREKFPFEMFGYVILSEHFHLIIKPDEINDFSKIIGCIKRNFTGLINQEYIDEDIPQSRIKRKEKGVWQRRFYEHIIRDDEDLYKHLDYIHYNPVKHGYVKKVKEWEHSSFEKFVKLGNYESDWGSTSDIVNLEVLECE